MERIGVALAAILGRRASLPVRDAEDGDHDQLLAAGGAYATMWSAFASTTRVA